MGSTPTVTFQTVLATVELRDSNEALVPNTGASTQYQPGSAGSFVAFGDGTINANGTETQEVLPVTNRYRVTYHGRSVDKQMSSTPVVYHLSEFP